ncbi:hypothetical protein N0V88_003343 [Collariella sp. IMI 366227]|nr:hypothetical protein N0V88_003343 [Collariella sp. IMI 366227]
MAPLRDIPRNIEGVTSEILHTLSPVLRPAPSGRSALSDKIKSHIAAICELAINLKLAMRRALGGYKVEVPSRDTKKWGEPGCDTETRELAAEEWLCVFEISKKVQSNIALQKAE